MNKIRPFRKHAFITFMSAGILLSLFFLLSKDVTSMIPAWTNSVGIPYLTENLPWLNSLPGDLLWADTAYSFTSVPYIQSLQPVDWSNPGAWSLPISQIAPGVPDPRWANAILNPAASPWIAVPGIDTFWSTPFLLPGRIAASLPVLSPVPPPAPSSVPAVPVPVGIDTGQLRYGPPASQFLGVTYTSDQPTYVNGQVLATFRPGTPPAEISRVYAVHQCREILTSPYAGYKLLAIPSFVTVLDMARKLSLEPSILYVSPNYYRHAHLIPNDPYYIYQWHLPRLNCSYAWDYSTGVGALVGLLDSGVAYQTTTTYALAPDLAGTLFVPGYDFINLDAYPNDDYGHGTHMAGCIAQTTNNLLGCSGVAFNASIMPVKVMDNLGSTPISAEADGIYFAANNGAKIINMSLGGTGTSATEHAAVTYAYNNGVTIICSSGNAGSSIPEYPASYTECISVSAIRYDYTKPTYSNYGTYIDVCSPGGDLTVDQNLDGFGDGILQQTFASPNYTTFYYYFMEGTSPAAALVSGVAALIISKSTIPLTPLQVTTTLETSATDLGTVGWDQYFGWGLVNAYLAVLRTL
ncbi:MAG: S8 family peptidase [bacterium]